MRKYIDQAGCNGIKGEGGVYRVIDTRAGRAFSFKLEAGKKQHSQT